MTLRKLSVIVNIAIFAAVMYAWLKMVLRFDENGALTDSGLRSLRYFTVLSNLLQAAASAAYVIAVLAGGVPLVVRVLKYAATASVTLTFLTVLLFLGPVMFGYKRMFEGASLWMHLIVPVAAILDFVLLDRSGPIPFAASFAALSPMLLYAAYYVGNLLINGFVKNGFNNDWYGFARGGWGRAGVFAAVMVLGTWGVALLLRLPRRS